ncbi:hypothetical protein LEP1GSC103_3668 [Leptospira borgpetersenii serovar Javanica str. UI 09931]|uniref:Uncharacterized protein n=2 Tax=Leptospira borgpetersenii TaxID=174 RepID=A0AAV3JGG8_LEPBO|nr:hypothetical protein LEP1GSC055_1643 [Leptospira borgpetersenii str. Brem 307]EMN17250.1 hypothetical protein LEP1GSC056_1384 [Leptospira borgpetersenii str. Brem 328]EMN60050.1 hypothetical protein LEP1GSC090_3204 [Leptospira borgpetersenii serovar Javanica str. MK146]EPG59508.1 hypothetical protein LEP1GSC103_3668 [Leptospira borgpetersenii serovar Javanica str. UI 09931]
MSVFNQSQLGSIWERILTGSDPQEETIGSRVGIGRKG